MRKAFSTTIIIMFLVLCVASLSLASHYANGTISETSFSDHFDGDQVSNMKWIVQENTNLSGLPAFGGSVKVADSQVTLASTGDGTSFPCVTSAFNPFPSSGDFVVEFDLTYDCLSDWGSGLWICKGPFVDGKSSGDIVFQVWGDNEASWTRSALRVYFFGAEVYRSEVEGWEPSAAAHTFRVEYIDDVYTVSVDSVEVASESSRIRPDCLAFGHPPSHAIPFEHERAIGNVGGWSSFRLDFIKVLPPAVVSLSTSPSQVQFGLAIDVSGTLSSREGMPLIGETVILSYMIPAVGEWAPVTSAVTDPDGAYIASWFPTATGTFGIKVGWVGNENFAGTYQVRNISVVRGNESGGFPFESNSTPSETSAPPTEYAKSSGLTASGAAIAVFVAGVLVYFRKRKR